jgi:alanyl-tRNA synthetase
MLDPKQVVEYIKVSSEVIDELQEKVASLEESNTELEKVNTKLKEANTEEKEASVEATPIFTEEMVRPVMNKLAKAKMVKNAEQATQRALEDPASLLLALDKVAAEAIASVPKLGSGVEPTEKIATERKSDLEFEKRFLNLRQKL